MPSPVGLVVKNGWNSLSRDLGRDAGAVVAHPDLDRVAEVARRHLQRRAEGRAPPLSRRALVGGIEAVAEQVEEHAGHVLRHQLDRRDAVGRSRVPA